MKTAKLSIQTFCLISVFTAIIVVTAWISIPLPYGVPMTLQTLAIPLAGVILGAKKGTISVLAYLLLGAIGIPVFAGFQGGVGVVFGYTGGFILSFPLMAAAAGTGAARRNKLWLWSGLAAGAMLNYTCGVLYFSLYTSCDLLYAFNACVLLFIPADIAKIMAVGLFGTKIKDILLKNCL